MNNRKYIIVACLTLLLVATYFNRKYEVIAINLFGGNELCEFKVMTWNIHCSDGADDDRQREIAELIIKENADFVLLNEYDQRKCKLTDSLLRQKYPFTEERQSRQRSGDIFYSKYAMSNSGFVYNTIKRKRTQTIKGTVSAGNDSVQIFGVHMANNHYNDSTGSDDGFGSDFKVSYVRYKEAQKRRCEQAKWTKEQVNKSKHPVIVMGDMNDFSSSKPLEILCSCGLRDAWWEAGNGYGHTFHEGWLRLRIDHVLYSEGLQLKSIKVIGTNQSDHNPVVAGFCINE